MQAECQTCARIAGASEPQASAALRPAPNMAGRPSWVRPQQQPIAVPPPAAEQALDAEPVTQPYPALHTGICPPPGRGASLEGAASGFGHAVRPHEAGTAAGIEADSAAGIAGGTAVQAGSSEGQVHHTEVSAQMTHKPSVIHMEDSCDDAVVEGKQAQPAFIIDIHHFPEPAVQVTCDVAPPAAAPSSAQASGGTLLCTSSPGPHAIAQPPSAAPPQTQRRAAAPSMAGIMLPSTADQTPTAYAAACVVQGQQEATQHALRPSGLPSPGLKPAPAGLVPTDAMGTMPIDPMGPVPIDTMGPVGSDAMGPVPIDAMGPMPDDAMGPWASAAMGPEPSDAMTVPDTPPYSYTSHVGSPTGPTWLSPMLTKQQPGQGKQYSPSMLGRPAGMPHMDSSLIHAAIQVQPSSLMGPCPAQAQQPLLSQLPEGHSVRAAAACAADVPPRTELGPGFQLHGQGQAASLRPGSIPTTVPAAVNQGRSPGHGIAAAATGVFAAWDRQKVIQSNVVSPGTVRPQAAANQLPSRQQSQQQQQSQPQSQQQPQQPSQQQQPRSTATLAAQASAKLADAQRQPRWASLPPQRHETEDSAAGKHLLMEAHARHADPDASESAKLSSRPCRAEHAPHQEQAASSLHISPQVQTAAPPSIVLSSF